MRIAFLHVKKEEKVASFKRVLNLSDRKFFSPQINGQILKLQVDSGSDITIISTGNWKKLGKPVLVPNVTSQCFKTSHQPLGIISVLY